MNYEKFSLAYGLDRPSPCEAGGRCRYFDKCGREKMACSIFWNYAEPKVKIVGSQIPSRRVYQKIFTA